MKTNKRGNKSNDCQSVKVDQKKFKVKTRLGRKLLTKNVNETSTNKYIMIKQVACPAVWM